MQSSRAQTVVHFVLLLMCTLLVGSSAIFYFDHIFVLCLMWTNYWCIVVLEHWVLHREYLDCGFEPWQAELTPEIWITGSAYTSVLRLQVVCLLPSPFIKPPLSFFSCPSVQAQSEDSSICDSVTDRLGPRRSRSHYATSEKHFSCILGCKWK